MNYHEIEFKYNASQISVEDFKEFCIEQNPHEYMSAHGEDHFYHYPKEADQFLRHRVGPGINELTIKKKLEENNNIRIEYNMPLELTVDFGQVKDFCLFLGYIYNNSIHKIAHTYTYPWYEACYYVCQDKNLKEIGRFIELELKQPYNKGEDAVFKDLVILEKLYKPLGINPKLRVIPSLFELFKK